MDERIQGLDDCVDLSFDSRNTTVNVCKLNNLRSTKSKSRYSRYKFKVYYLEFGDSNLQFVAVCGEKLGVFVFEQYTACKAFTANLAHG